MARGAAVAASKAARSASAAVRGIALPAASGDTPAKLAAFGRGKHGKMTAPHRLPAWHDVLLRMDGNACVA
jgi:hypothetical protein